ncbi:MAG TPA: carbohydrate ABC transporter permease [Mesotoga sp.]|nr:sugar ABC transporter permease [Mesotoga sp. SC_NapDC3]PXF34168.1 sugar ABC transporter permease [Mesotoga sp. SC_NapDC]RIZ61067.1 sugar ABC transporter permease [Mesotoga sp. SC_NapDC2]HNS35377.1 carbohydrate ABC transporter permease [Mesotoga sp.]HNU22927.1 carbohydrate ABC transporter permease [Mesotoga sp.]
MKKIPMIILYVILFAASVVWIYPYIWMLLSSFKPTNEIYGGFLPSRFTLDNYRFILEAADKMERPFIQALGNSVFISVTVTFGVLVTSALVGFGLSRLSFKGRNVIFNFIIFQMIFPGFLFIVPLYVLIRNLGLIDTRTALILPSLVSAWGVFMFTQSFRAVPNEYLEAARMDGANDLWIITKVLIPLTSSTVSIVGLFTFIGIWDNFMWPLIVVSDYSKMPLSVLLASFNMQYGSYLGPVLAGSVLQTMPMVVIFLVFRKYFLQGISMSLK